MPRPMVLLTLLLSTSSTCAFAEPGADLVEAVRAGDWGASWIWSSEDGPANTWMAFRKTFELASAPDVAVARIAAETKYWLWINGELVVFEGALPRGPRPGDGYYDTVDLAPFLVAGSNTVAILVWHWGKDGFYHQNSGRGGLLFEADLGAELVVSDATWKRQTHAAFKRVTADPQPNFRHAAANVRFEAEDDALRGWTETDFDDGSWPAAVAKGVPPAAPWNELDERPIPLWIVSELNSYENDESFPAFGDGGTIVAELPYDAQVTPYLEVEAAAGLLIDIRTDAYRGGGEYNFRAEYVTRGGLQEFETPGWLSGHKVLYTVPAGVRILALKYRESGYDTAFDGSFSSSDERYDRLWNKARRTLYVNMRDHFTDCPDRERAQWWGDVVIQLGQAFYAFDQRSHALINKAIDELMGWQRSDGTFFSPVPAGNWDNELPLQMLAAVGWYGLWTYYLYTGDADTITSAYPRVGEYLELWSFDAEGLVEHREGDWDWADWGENIDVRVLENAWYALALRAAAQMAELAGDFAGAAIWEQRLADLSADFRRVLWTGDGYRSSEHTGELDDRGNALAVVAGLATPEQYPALRQVLTTSFWASPYMEKYVLEALFLIDDPEAALDRMNTRYAAMVDSPLTTLWEVWTLQGPRTYNHAWAGGPLTLLSQYAVGVAPRTAAWETYQVLPREGPLTSIEVTVPSVRGEIAATIHKSGTTWTLELESPSGTSAIVGIPRHSFVDQGLELERIEIGGIVVWGEGPVGAVPGVDYRGEDELRVHFDVEPGSWTFVAVSEPTSIFSDGFESGDLSAWSASVGLRSSAEPGAGGGTRTPTPFRAADFKSAASTDSATPAAFTFNSYRITYDLKHKIWHTSGTRPRRKL